MADGTVAERIVGGPDRSDAGGRQPSHLAALWGAACLVALPMLYWQATGQVWEDFLITFRVSHNLVTGHGLTYNVDTRVHAFTSPLNVLLPALFDWLTRTGNYEAPLALYNVVALAALVAGGLCLARTSGTSALDDPAEGDATSRARLRWIACVLPLALVLCPRVTAFTVNGQEAGFWVLFLALAFAALTRGHAVAWKLGGLAWGGLMWTRPDSPVHIALLGLIALAWPAGGDRRAELRGLLRSAGLCAAVYLPWFLFTWAYYGSPVPHSLQAKLGAYVSHDTPWGFWGGLKIERVRDAFGGWLCPIYGIGDSDWGGGWLWGAGAAGTIAAGAWTLRRLSRVTRCASAAFAGSVLYLLLIWERGLAFPWYSVPTAVFGVVVWARLPWEATKWLHGRRRIVAACVAGLLPLTLAAQFLAGQFPCAIAQERLIERGGREQIGLFLRDHVQPGEHVFLEPIGYIGYYSGASLYDFPGLTSQEVLAARREGLDFFQILHRLKPEWLVLRPPEVEVVRKDRELTQDYKVVATSDEREKVLALKPMRGLIPLYYDACFVVLHREPAR